MHEILTDTTGANIDWEYTKNQESWLANLLNYSASEEQINQSKYLLNLLNLAYLQWIIISVVWWYWLDSLIWFSTRDHGDFDLLIKENKIEEFKRMLFSLWCTLYEETSFVLRFKTENGLKIEFNNKWTLNKLWIQEDDKNYFPEECNWNLDWVKIYTPSLIWHKRLIEIQNQRAKELWWTEYKYKKHQLSIIRFLEQKSQK